MQQGGSQYGVSPEMTPFSATASRTQMLSAGSDQQNPGDGALAVEAASPISSLPPPPPRPGLGPSSANFDELVPVSGGFPDDDALAGDETERGVTGGNRWPRQETLALLKVRSEMDAVFRDATLKGPLWEDVSRKLAELGYNRSAKKCKEKFENVHKYYKRTKEGRAGRQDGKSYRFFSQLEALHSSSSNTAVHPMTHTTTITTTTTATAAVPASIGIVGPSARIQPPPISVTQTATTSQIGIARGGAPHDLGAAMATGISGSSAATAGISFSSDTSFSSSDSSDQDLEGGPSGTHSRKRKRGSRGGSSSRKMMAFFQGLMQQVMEKQEIMQQRFLETIEKREQDRMIREEAWKRQEMARLTREHDLMAQERAISASRDAAVIAFLQKITGQAIQLQPPVTIPSAPPPQAVPAPPPLAPTPPPEHHHQPQQQQHNQQQQYHQQHHHHQPQNTEITRHQPASSEVVIAVPEQQHPPAQEMGRGGSGSGSGGVSFDPTSSRWPKAEVLALIKLRSGLESRYQEAGPKGILWEEISAGMKRMGYNRSAKRCKEKWENINKYFKKVKESNKKRPEDAKTCPYFHQLDALYRKKILGSTSGSGGTSSSYATQNKQEQQPQQEPVTMEPNTTTNLQERSDVLAIMPAPTGPSPQSSNQTIKSENKNNNNGGNTEAQNGNGDAAPASLFGEGNISGGGGATTASAQKPEDIVKELIERQQHHHRPSITNDYDKLEEAGDSDNLDQEEEEEDDEDEEDGAEDESKLTYKIQLQRQNTGSSNGGGNAATSFMAMVQ